MSEKERLEEIEERYANRKTTMIPVYQDDYNYLIKTAKQQAEQYQELKEHWEHDTWQLAHEIKLRKKSQERVQELEHDKEHLELIKDRQEEEYRSIYAQTKRCREGLEKIAHVRNGFNPLAIEARITIEEVDRLAGEQ